MKPDSRAALVYIVDDDPSVRKAIGRLMRTAGFEVREFATPEGFLSASEEVEPACALLDPSMPGLSGQEVQNRLRAKASDWPVIAVSAHEEDSARKTSRQLGARFFFRKPVDAQALLDAVTWLTGARGAGG